MGKAAEWRLNSDADLRALERQVAAGDLTAFPKLMGELRRAGHFAPLEGVDWLLLWTGPVTGTGEAPMFIEAGKSVQAYATIEPRKNKDGWNDPRVDVYVRVVGARGPGWASAGYGTTGIPDWITRLRNAPRLIPKEKKPRKRKNSDEELRGFERAAKAQPHDQAARQRLLLAEVRSGRIPEAFARLAAALGDADASAVFGAANPDLAAGFQSREAAEHWIRELVRTTSRVVDSRLVPFGVWLAAVAVVEEVILMERNDLDYRHWREQGLELLGICAKVRKAALQTIATGALPIFDSITELRAAANDVFRQSEDAEIEGMEALANAAASVMTMCEIVESARLTRRGSSLRPQGSAGLVKDELLGLIDSAVEVMSLGDVPIMDDWHRTSVRIRDGMIHALLGRKAVANPGDEARRELERRVATGDRAARKKLYFDRLRRGDVYQVVEDAAEEFEVLEMLLEDGDMPEAEVLRRHEERVRANRQTWRELWLIHRLGDTWGLANREGHLVAMRIARLMRQVDLDPWGQNPSERMEEIAAIAGRESGGIARTDAFDTQDEEAAPKFVYVVREGWREPTLLWDYMENKFKIASMNQMSSHSLGRLGGAESDWR